jgi:hypothetical protein
VNYNRVYYTPIIVLATHSNGTHPPPHNYSHSPGIPFGGNRAKSSQSPAPRVARSRLRSG